MPLSKWPEAEALKDKSAASVAGFVFRLMCRHGCPTIRISDQGREFVNAFDTELCKLSAYHPQTNGQDERFNQTLQRSLQKMVNEDQNDWDKYIDSVLFAYTVHLGRILPNTPPSSSCMLGHNGEHNFIISI